MLTTLSKRLLFNPFMFKENFAGNSDLDPDKNYFKNWPQNLIDSLLSDQFLNYFKKNEKSVFLMSPLKLWELSEKFC